MARKTMRAGGARSGSRDLWTLEIATRIEERIGRTNYGALMDRDLEVGTGAIDGAIRALVCPRVDNGSMRWLEERSEALLQLGCIDTKGGWDAFVRFVHDKTRARGDAEGKRITLQQRTPQALPTLREAA